MDHLNPLFRTLFTAMLAMMIIVVFDSCEDDDGMGGDPNPTTTTGTASGTATDTDTGGGTPGTDTDTDTDSGMDTDSDSGMGSDADGGMGSDPVFISCFDGGQMGNVGEPGINYSDVTDDSSIPIQLGNTWNYNIANGEVGQGPPAMIVSDQEMFIDGMQFIWYLDGWFHVDFNDYFEAIDVGGGEWSIVRIYRQGLNEGDEIEIIDEEHGITGMGTQLNDGFDCSAGIDGFGLCSRYNVTISINGEIYRDQRWWVQDGVGIVQLQEGGSVFEIQLDNFELSEEEPFIDAGVTASESGGAIPFSNGNSWTYSSSVGEDFTIELNSSSELELFNRQFYWFFDRWIFSRQGEFEEVIDANGDCALRTILDFNAALGDERASEVVSLANGDEVQVMSTRSFEGFGTSVNDISFTDIVVFEVQYLTNGMVTNNEQWWVVEGVGVIQLTSENPEFEYEILDWEVL